MAELVVIEGQDIGRTFEIGQGISTLGRSKKNTIPLSDRRIGERQAQIEIKNSQVRIKNIFPSKSVLVNGDPVEEADLQHGDMITLGNTTFLFSEDDPSQTVSFNAGVKNFELSDRFDTAIHARKTQDLDSVLLDLSDSADDQERRISTLYRVSHAISATLDKSTLLNNLLDILFGELSLVDRGVILLFDEEHGRFVPTASKIKDRLATKDIKVSKTILKTAYESQESIISNDALFDDRFKEGMSIAEQNIRSAMCAPLINQEKVIGFIHVDTTSSGQQFTNDHLNFLTAVAMQSAVAISHAHNYQKYKVSAEKLAELGRATQELSYHLQKYPILRSLGKYLFKILNCRRCLLALVNEQNKIIFTPYVMKSQEAKWDETQLTVIRDLCQKVIQDNSPILISDLTFDPALYFEEREQRMDSFLIVPVPFKSDDIDKENRAVGAICISEKASGGAFTQEDQELLNILANQVGIALANAELYEQATVDSLTQVFVRRYFFQRLEKEIKRSIHKDSPLSLLMLDLDHFKMKNDNYGHQAGDHVLRETGKILKKNLRAEHVVARYGGEEFAIILRDQAQDLGVKIGERIRKAVESNEYIFEGTKIPCTVSIGGSTIEPGDTPDTLIKRADEALYCAKDGGRNRVVFG